MLVQHLNVLLVVTIITVCKRSPEVKDVWIKLQTHLWETDGLH